MNTNRKRENGKKGISSADILVGVVVFALALFGEPQFGNASDWNIKKVNGGKVTVKSNISTRIDESGKEAPLIEYVATSVEKTDMKKCISVMKDVSKHKIFLDKKESKIVKTVSDSEWILYYFFDMVWPLNDFDVVTVMKHTEDVAKKTATFTFTAAPKMLEKTAGLARASYGFMEYAFRDLGNGDVGLTVSATVSPSIEVPDWMIRAALPGAAGDIIQKIFKLAKNG